MKNRFVRSASEALLSIQIAYKHIFDGIRMPYTISSYSALVNKPNEYQRWLCKRIGLEFSQEVEIINGDKKYE